MAKTSKRSKKFVKKGGVTAALSKGTVAKKGKFVMKRKKGTSFNNNEKKGERFNDNKGNQTKNKASKKADNESFVDSSDAVATLDIDSFFRDATAEADADVDAASLPSEDDHDNDDGDNNSSDSGDSSVDADDKAKTKKDKQNAAAAADDDDDDDSSMGSDDSSDVDIYEQERLMKEEIQALSHRDPDFHSFLVENEKSLLEFGQNEDGEIDSENDSDSEQEEENDTAKAKDKKRCDGAGHGRKRSSGTSQEQTDEEMAEAKDKSKKEASMGNENKKVLTPSILKKLERQAFGGSFSLRALRSLLSAYRTAAHYADADLSRYIGPDGYTIESSVVFDRLMMSCLRNCQVAFRHHFLLKTNSTEGKDDNENVDAKMDVEKPIHPKQLEKAPAKVATSFQSFMDSTLHLLDKSKDSELLSFVLRSLSNYIPFLSLYPKVARNLLDQLKELWIAPLVSGTSHWDSKRVRLHSFLRIRQLALTQPFPFIEDCLKSMYLAFAKSAKVAIKDTTFSAYQFWINCLVELYSLDLDSSYQHAFVYIRQLALHLRTALHKKDKESIRAVYCSQYLTCCRFWVELLCANPSRDKDGGLYSLVYPMTEIIMGVMRLLPAPRYLPLRLNCVHMLQKLAASTETFIPTACVLLDALELNKAHDRPNKAGTSKKKKNYQSSNQPKVVTRLDLVLKLPEDGMKNPEQAELCVIRTFSLLSREVDLYRYSPAFPEFSVRICQFLRRFAKDTRNSKWRSMAKGCVDVCEKQSTFAIEARSKLEQAPKQIRRIEALKPKDAPGMEERFNALVEKERANIEMAATSSLTETNRKEGMDTEDTSKQGNWSHKPKKSNEGAKKEAPNVNNAGDEDEIEEGVDWPSDDDSSQSDT